MTRDEWLQVKTVAADALAMPAAERDAYIAARWARGSALYREVSSLLDAADKADGLFESPCLTTGGVLDALGRDGGRDVVVGGRIGAYRVVSELGRGGMGTAYLAVRADEAFDKRVAIKLIKRGMDTDAILHRFHRERQILADLEHPNIVMLLDGGSTPDGRPYYVMEYVDGTPIDEYCTSRGLDIAARLELLRQVCAAVDYAHARHVVHRDLKPGNILVTAAGMPKLLDFGIARLFDATAGPQTREPTLLAQAMTLRYASPEQVRGESLGPASDIYALGVLFYELVTGRSPYGSEQLSSRELEQRVCNQVPARPSTTFDASTRRQLAASTGRPRAAARDLDTIALTALAKVPAARYASAQALADDIGRWLGHEPVTRRRPRQRARRQLGIVAGAMALVLAVAATLFLARSPPAPVGARPEVASVAVLPFAHWGPGTELESLAEGFSEDVLNRLSRLPGARVIAHDSSFKYRGDAVDALQAGRELGVRYVLAGRFTQQGAALTVAAQLIDTIDGHQLWGERFERESGDLLALQEALATAVAARLELASPQGPNAPAAMAYTSDPQAYESYLKGRYFWNKRTSPAFLSGVAHFRQAIDRDPRFALAWVGLADSYGLLTEYHVLDASETWPLVREAISRALELDPQLPEALVSLAYQHQYYEWDFPAAEREYSRALALNPNYATGRQWYAEFLSAMGRHDEALVEIRAALAIDPLSLIINTVYGKLLNMSGHPEEAVLRLDEVIAMDATFPEAYENLKRAYVLLGRYRDSIDARQSRRRVIGFDTTMTPALEAAAAATSPAEYWRGRLEQEIAESQSEGFLPFEFAEIYAQAGDSEKSLDWLERACRAHDFQMVFARTAPYLAPLREDARFRVLYEHGCAVAARG